jgi:glycosyltransferase involved in cell wall biosynthesis
VSTYNQPEKLRVALASIELQTRPVDEVIVVGDCCLIETSDVVEEFPSLKIRYVNLPLRCGEQAIPNAIGTLLAKSSFVAYLNHDDLWLPEHIETALKQIQSRDAKWFIGGAAFCEDFPDDDDSRMYMFSSRTQPDRSVKNSFAKSHLHLEPASSWVFDRHAVLSVGNWSPAWQLARTPVSELPLRIWKKYGEPEFGSEVSVAKILGNRWSKPGPHYFQSTELHDFLILLLRRKARKWVDKFVWPTLISEVRNRPVFGFGGLCIGGKKCLERFTLSSATLYKIVGIDVVELYLRGKQGRGSVLEHLLARRTGELKLKRRKVAYVQKLLEGSPLGE